MDTPRATSNPSGGNSRRGGRPDEHSPSEATASDVGRSLALDRGADRLALGLRRLPVRQRARLAAGAGRERGPRWTRAWAAVVVAIVALLCSASVSTAPHSAGRPKGDEQSMANL